MKNFDLAFTYEGQPYTAHVSVLQNSDHIQYTITPYDEKLKAKFLSQVIHQFKNRPIEFAFPVNGPDHQPYNLALDKALKARLKKEGSAQN